MELKKTTRRRLFLFCNLYRQALLRGLGARKFETLSLEILDNAQLNAEFLARPELDLDTTAVLVSDDLNPPRGFDALFWNYEQLDPQAARSGSKALYIIPSPFIDRRHLQILPLVRGAPDQWLGQIVFASEIVPSVTPVALELFNQLMPDAKASVSRAEQTLIASLASTRPPDQAHQIYKEFQACLRLFLVVSLRQRFEERFVLYGDDWGRHEIQAQPSNYNPLMYFGNICIDLGSWSGVGSLYPRSVQILENGGILLQKRGSGSGILGAALEELCLFDTLEELHQRIVAFSDPDVRLRYFIALLDRFGQADREQETHLIELLYE